MANMTAVPVAARRALGPNVGRGGLWGGVPLTMYVSTEAHHSLVKAADVLGIGTDHVRHMPVDDVCRMDVAALRQALAADAASGQRPFLVAATAGTTRDRVHIRGVRPWPKRPARLHHQLPHDRPRHPDHTGNGPARDTRHCRTMRGAS